MQEAIKEIHERLIKIHDMLEKPALVQAMNKLTILSEINYLIGYCQGIMENHDKDSNRESRGPRFHIEMIQNEEGIWEAKKETYQGVQSL